MQLKRTMGIGVLVLVMALVLSACTGIAPQAGAPADAPAAASEATTITWAFWGSPEEAASHKIVADAFMAEHPEIQVELWNQPWDDYFTKIQALWASGDTKVIPDVAFLWPTPRYAAEGVLENLDPFIAAAGYDLEDYWPGLLESAKFEGSVYGFPRDIEVNVIYYNKDMFDAAGVAYPSDDWTWDDFLAAAEALTQKDANGMTTVYALAAEGGKWGKWVNQNGGAILDDYVNPSKCMLTDPASVAAYPVLRRPDGAGLRHAPGRPQPGGRRCRGLLQRAGGHDPAEHQPRLGLQRGGHELRRGPGADPGGRQALERRWRRGLGDEQRQRQQGCRVDLHRVAAERRRRPDDLHRARRDLPGAAVGGKFALLHDRAAARQQAGGHRRGERVGRGRLRLLPRMGRIDGSIIGPGLEKIWAGEIDVETGLADVCAQVDQFLADNGYPK
jgi:multiple sugar transport system substrate-binding protein